MVSHRGASRLRWLVGAYSVVALAVRAGWATHHGATHLYLQLEPDNTGARRLYERAGFTELCGYHYRAAL